MRRDELMHYGMPRRSGRYPWGSGEDPYQHSGDFMNRVNELRKQGVSEVDIAKMVGVDSTTNLRAYYAVAKNQVRADTVARAKSLLADGHSVSEIGRIMGRNESSIRSLLNEEAAARSSAAMNAAKFIEAKIDEVGKVDVGAGVEQELNISATKMAEALAIVRADGYEVYGGSAGQMTNPGKRTILKVACPPGTPHSDIYKYDEINSLNGYKCRYDEDGSEHFDKAFVYPKSMDSRRLEIRYAEDGGKERDGLVEIRRGVEDLSLGNSHYAQVRILVDNDHYIKGMAAYADDLPDGIDIRFNTNKSKSTPKMDVLKKISSDPDNPFGSTIKEDGGQYYYTDKDGNRQLGLINKRADEGDWGEWSKSLPSQFLSKQSMHLINRQLNQAINEKRKELDEIEALTNPTVKKKMLEDFANDCDSTAVHLQAAALPGQRYQVILPVASMKDNEVYAPNYPNGETLALIRYPHAGTFEIPIVKVNNRQAEARKLIGTDSLDAVGINSSVAARLSGADFDGDTVMVIPCNSPKSNVKIISTAPLEDLKDFDPKMEYPEVPGMKYMRYTDKKGKEHDSTQQEMGRISNLITDMTLKGADEKELARAVRHSMVVIDAGKHKLNYKLSEEENGIAALRKKYQGRVDADGNRHGGASTLISRASSPYDVLKRKGSPKIDPETGELVYKTVREEYVDKNGKTRVRTTRSTQMAETTDARTLSSGTPQEEAYAQYANTMKAMANEARKQILTAGKIEYNSSAKKAYEAEADALLSALNVAKKNAPRERQAQLYANSVVKAKKQDNPGMTKEEERKAGQQALARGRAMVGAKRETIKISDRQWEAIQAGAISENTLAQILRFADTDRVRQLATPRNYTVLTPAKEAKIRQMRASGYTTEEIARASGVSASTVSKFLSGKE